MPPSTHPFGIPCYLLRTLLKTSKPNVKYRCTYNCCKRSYSPNTENPDFLFFNFLCCGKSESFIAISETICVLLLIWSTDDLASYNLKEITWESGHCSFSCWRCKCSTYQWGSFILLWLLWVAVLLFRGTTGFFFSFRPCSVLVFFTFLIRTKCWSDDTQQQENVPMDQLFS